MLILISIHQSIIQHNKNVQNCEIDKTTIRSLRSERSIVNKQILSSKSTNMVFLSTAAGPTISSTSLENIHVCQQ